MSAPTSTALLVRAVQNGEVQRFGELVHRFDEAVRGLVARRVPDPGGLEEVVQQAFYLAFRGLGALERPERFEAWLLRIARNCAVEHARGVARRSALPLPEDEAPSAVNGPSWVWDEVAVLDEDHRTVLRLRYLGGCSYSEIAKRLGVPTSTVRGRIFEARRALRRRLSDSEGT